MDENKKQESFEEEMNQLDLNRESKLAKPQVSGVSGIDIGGLEDVPTSIIPIPYVRLVQPTSTKIETADGKDAPAGTFYFNDSKRAEESLTVAIIKAKHGAVTYKRDDEEIHTSKLALLCKDLVNEKIFILSLSVMSFSAFGQLVAQLKEKEIKNIWENEIIIKSEKQENEKGKYYIAKFELGNKLPKKDVDELTILSQKYMDALERNREENQVA